MIKIPVNNKRTLNITQTADNGIHLETVNSNGTSDYTEIISEGDFVMLLNYYHYVMRNDIQNDFINPYGTVDE